MSELFCRNCGTRVAPGTRFCPNCGLGQPMPGPNSGPNSGPNPGPNSGPYSGSYTGPNPGPMPQQQYYGAPVYREPDAPSGGYAALGFFFPVVGLILYLVWKDTTPLRAKSAGKGALAGVITQVGLSILIVIIAVVLAASAVYI